MSGTARARRTAISVLLLAGLLAPAAGFGPALGSPEPPSIEVTFPSAIRYATVVREPDGTRLLVAGGDILFGDPPSFARVEQVQAERLLIRTADGGVHGVRVGQKIPGVHGLRFASTAMVRRLEYRYRPVERLDRLEPVLVALEGSAAVLMVEVPARPALSPVPASAVPPPAAVAPADVRPGHAASAQPGPRPPDSRRALMDGELLAGVQVDELGADRYEVKRDDVRAVLDNAGRVLSDLRVSVLPTLSLDAGIGYKVSSAAGDGLLGPRGFTVYDPKVASRAGIEVGDRILSVNGTAVNGLLSLYRLYREVSKHPGIATIEVELERNGTTITKSYRIR
ncbi:MAG: hypothetical protein ACE148_17820 [Vicinamibacterales bacterium]